MAKRVFNGWVGKRSRIPHMFYWNDSYDFPLFHTPFEQIFRKRGSNSDWMPEDWPPKRIKITVEME